MVQPKLMRVGGDYCLLVMQLNSLFDYLTALLEYLDLEDGRPYTLFDKSGETSTLYFPIYYPQLKCLP